MSVPTLPGITAKMVTTGRLTTRVLFSGPEDGIPILLIHGNFSSATWWEETMLQLPPQYRAIAPDQRSFGGADPDVHVDATKGMGEFVDDAIALVDQLGYDKVHLVGNSLGGLVAWWMMADHPDSLISVTLAGPGSPYGFGGTKDARGTPTTDDFAGSGGGLVNPEFVKLLEAGDRSTDSPFSPRHVLRLLVWGPPFIPEREDALVEATFEAQLGDYGLPGDKALSPNWPYVSPGKWGPSNAMSPKYIGNLVERLANAEPKVPVIWIYGADDVAVSNSAASDPGTWGPTGILPGFPGTDEYPNQPMMDQIRTVLDDYAARGGTYKEVAIEGSGHVPFFSHPDEFNSAFHAYLEQVDGQAGGKQ
ncbi:MAG: alpha/beta hydrolase [Actinomycetota bacterium]|nr:alpha/beta hydrolase [Actinomycetota bacterium]